MNFSPEVTLGNILTIGAFAVAALGGFYGLKGRLDVLGQIIRNHADTMAAHNLRVDRLEQRHEQRMTKAEDNQEKLRQIVDRLVGEREARWEGEERRSRPRGPQ